MLINVHNIYLYIMTHTSRCDKAKHPRVPPCNGCTQALKPVEIIFPSHDLTSWRRGDQRSAAKQISVDKYVSHEIWRNMKKMARKWLENGMRNSVQTETN